ncbi:hypothetical protein ABN028_01360 [Actinopolymorpha sp. B17G11]|uniref:hypothetical protein n=1 Tax=Actinopolymorpha sp. B17G11 TaxID=3160861 RepID=UPI0032E3F293
MTGFADQVHRFLAEAVVDREEVDRFLDPDEPKWARFDSELGYLPHPSEVQDGVDGAVSTYRYGGFGERRVINGADRPCRINTYGDSFTQCHQVSDGETWQEYLAGHFGEPIRNFGVGGFGVHQAYRRLRRTEATDAGAEYVVFNIFLDDHYRSLDAYRRLRVGHGWWEMHRSQRTSMFHANPWVHVRFDGAGQLVERPNSCPTPESLYQLCDRDFLIDSYDNDLVVQLLVGQRTRDFDFLAQHTETAAALGLSLDLTSEADRERAATEFYDRCAFRASIILLDRMRSALAEQGKKLLVLLSYPGDAVADACAGKPRPDAEFVTLLDDLGIAYVDSLTMHVADYAAYTTTPEEYIDRHYIDGGHYSPAGNHYFAFAVKPAFVRWLQPRPPSYATDASAPPVRAEHLA